MNSNLKLNVVITGGTSGLGKSLAKQLVAMGCRVFSFARTPASIAALKKEVPEVGVIQADISEPEDIYRISGVAFQELGSVDVLVNNASELGPTPLKLLLDTQCEDFEKVLQTNLLGPFRLAKVILPSMLTRKKGLIINISSDAATSAYPRWGIYSVSKAALDHLTRILNAELEGTGVRSIAIDPGDMNTPMHLAAVPDADVARLKSPDQAAHEIIQWITRGDFSLERIKL